MENGCRSSLRLLAPSEFLDGVGGGGVGGLGRIGGLLRQPHPLG